MRQAGICLQWPTILFLELMVAKSGLNAMVNFSLRHSLHFFVTEENVGIFDSKIFHSTLGFLPSSVSFQK